MEHREFSLLDRILGEFSKTFSVLGSPAHSSRDYPAQQQDDSNMSPAERSESARLMRVNHAGEIAAQALYQGQAFFARQADIAAAMYAAGAEEADHLAWCEQRLKELGGQTSLLNPVWYAGSFLLGAVAAATGDRGSLGFITETEKQVEAHLHEHLQRLPSTDLRSRCVIEAMKSDEARHGAAAAAMGGKTLPDAIGAAMRLTSKLMTRASYWL